MTEPLQPKNEIVDSGDVHYARRLLLATPTTGLVRMEWVAARYNQVIPTNWSKTDMTQYLSSFIPLRYQVADAQNLAVHEALEKGFEWLLFIEHDTMPPPDALLRFTEYMDKGDIPVVSGLYFTRSIPAEPMVYRGRGNHYFRGWKLGDRVWVDGVPTGMLLVSSKLLKTVYDDSPTYRSFDGKLIRRVFDSPMKTWFNEDSGAQETLMGTSDLDFCTKVIKKGYLKKDFPEIAKKKYPFLIDTQIYCKHIESTGEQFPLEFPAEFTPPGKYKGKEIT